MSGLLLQLGAEDAPLADHVRLAPTLAGDLEYIAAQGLPFPDRSVAAVHCAGLIELMTQAEGLSLLRECRRVLRPGGTLRIGTPDLDAIAAAYQSGDWGARLPEAGQAEWVEDRAVALNLQLRGRGRRWLYNETELVRAAAFAGLGAPRHAGPNGRAGQDGNLWLEFSADKPALPARPLVSIVIPAYRVRFFGVALDSALAQTYPNLEILVLDDSGDDAIAELVASRDAAQRIRYLRNTPPLGEAASLTRGIHAARGELIKPLYDDDRLAEHCVARLVAAMRAAPDALLALSRRDTIDAAGAPVAVREQPLANAGCEISGASLAAFTLATGRNFLGPPSSVMFRRAPALTIPGNVMTLAGRLTNGTGDVTLYLNLLSRGEAVFVNEVLSAFRLHDSHTSSDPAIGHAERASWLYLKEHGARLGLTKDNFEIVIKRVLPEQDLRRDLDLVILDDIFPQLLSAFRVAEYNQYLGHFPSALVLSTGASFGYLHEHRSLAQVRDEYELHYPMHRGRVREYAPAMLGRARLAYTVFINNAYGFCEELERHQVPFVFCLYPGGGFVIDGAESDRKLRRVFASPCFRKVICTQKISRDYLLAKGLCPPERIEFIFGGVHFPPAADTPPKRRYGVDKQRFDICFVANKYSAGGRDKGYDVFVAVAKQLAPRFPDMRFHVVGNFTRQEIDVEELGDGIQFHGLLNTARLAGFYAGMEIILSPNRPFILSPGSFDGFPTGTCVEAGLGGVALFIADPLRLSPFKDGEEIVVIGDDADEICRRIAAFHAAPEQLHLLAGRGARRLHELYGMNTQMGPRVALLEQCLG